MKEEERPGSVGMVSVARSLREGNLLKITGAWGENLERRDLKAESVS